MAYDIIESCKSLKSEIKPTVLYVICDNPKLVNELVQDDELISGVSVIFATTDKSIDRAVAKKNVKLKHIVERPAIGLNTLSQIKDLLMEACVVGTVNINDRVLCLLADDINCLLYFDVKEIGIPRVRDVLSARLTNPAILESTLNLAFELAREGREGKRLGALFVIGDAKNVLRQSRQLVINPFEGHKQRECSILNIENWETMKEFAQLDGAFVINDKGIAVAAGRYINISAESSIQSGLGGRHLAAASISKTTAAVAITVSASGIVRIFKDGEVIFRVNAV
jgi:DNA integrity scanning protein DisA with diadenylate cyclase activity